MSIELIEKLQHVPRNLDDYILIKGFSHTQERPMKTLINLLPLANLEAPCKQEGSTKIEL